MRRRLVIFAVGLPLYVVVLVLAGTVLLGLVLETPFLRSDPATWVGDLADLLTDGAWLGWAALVAVLVTATQLIFLLPVIRLRPPQGDRSRPMAVSLTLGAIITGVVTVGFLTGLSELVASIVTGRFTTSPWSGGGNFADQWWVGALVVVMLLASWCFWAAVLLIFSRELWADRALGRLVGLLLGGTVLELVIVMPIDAMVRRRTDCYCATGTFYALCVATAGLVWLAGPGVWFAWTRRRRKLWRRQYCGRCGHARGPSPGERCPECGFAWGEPAA